MTVIGCLHHKHDCVKYGIIILNFLQLTHAVNLGWLIWLLLSAINADAGCSLIINYHVRLS
jgi:hypothetical protein